MQPEDSLPCLQEPTTDPYSEPNESSTQFPTIIALTSILILSF
jgi:hypothetical protein